MSFLLKFICLAMFYYYFFLYKQCLKQYIQTEYNICRFKYLRNYFIFMCLKVGEQAPAIPFRIFPVTAFFSIKQKF